MQAKRKKKKGMSAVSSMPTKKKNVTKWGCQEVKV